MSSGQDDHPLLPPSSSSSPQAHMDITSLPHLFNVYEPFRLNLILGARKRSSKSRIGGVFSVATRTRRNGGGESAWTEQCGANGSLRTSLHSSNTSCGCSSNIHPPPRVVGQGCSGGEKRELEEKKVNLIFLIFLTLNAAPPPASVRHEVRSKAH